MLAARSTTLNAGRRYVTALHSIASSQSTNYGRTAAYRRLQQHLESNSASPNVAPLLPQSARTAPNLIRSFHTSSIWRQTKDEVKEPSKAADEAKPEAKTEAKTESEQGTKEDGEGETKEENKKDEKDAPPPPPHGDKTPWQVFTETFRTELKASKEWEESTKQLAGEVQEFRDSEGVKRARAGYDATTGKAAEAIKGTAKAVGQGAAWTWETPVVQGIRKGVNATGRGIEKASRPIRDTQAFKDISEAIDDGSSARYGGWVEKEERRKRRELRDLKEGRKPIETMVEDPDAGTNITVHKDAAWREAWNNFKDNSRIAQSFSSMRNTYEESENPLISTARAITDRISGFFAENETAMVIKKFREIDPTFQTEPFLREMREYILPEVLDAYVKGDVEVLKLWLSAAQFQVYSALMEQYTKAGLKSDGRILDIRGVDILNAKLLEPGEIPVFIVTCRTQEVHVYRNKKTNELAAGMEDKVQQVTYAIGVTRLPDEVSNPETRGWRMIELQKSGRDYY